MSKERPFVAVVGHLLVGLAVTVPHAQAQTEPTLYKGETLWVRLETPLNSGTAHVGDKAEATVRWPVYSHGKNVLPEGTSIMGTVVTARHADKSRRIPAILQLEFNQVTLPDGLTVQLKATSEVSNQRWTQRRSEMLLAAAGGVGFGAGVGLVVSVANHFGVGWSLAAGVALGAAFGAGSEMLTRRKQWKDVSVKKKRLISIHLDEDLTIPAAPPAKP